MLAAVLLKVLPSLLLVGLHNLSTGYQFADHYPADAPLINPATAWECLKSTPFDTVKAKAFIEEIKKYVASQSTLAYLKNPPKGYLMPAVDILGEIEKVKETIYNSHYDFDVAIYKVMNAGELSSHSFFCQLLILMGSI